MDTQHISLLVGSGDNNASGNASSFAVQLGAPFPIEGDWEICMVNITFPKPIISGNSIFVLCNLVSQQIVGSNSLRLLNRLEPCRSSDEDPTWRTSDYGFLNWKKLDADMISRIEIQVISSSGAPVPTSGNDRFSTVELRLRRVS